MNLLHLFLLRLLSDLFQLPDRFENFRDIGVIEKLIQIAGIDSDLLQKICFLHEIHDSEIY